MISALLLSVMSSLFILFAARFTAAIVIK